MGNRALIEFLTFFSFHSSTQPNPTRAGGLVVGVRFGLVLLVVLFDVWFVRMCSSTSRGLINNSLICK